MEASHTKLKSCQSFHGPSRAPPECRPYLQSHFELRAIVVSPSSNDHPYTCPLCMRPQILKADTANTAIPIIHHLRRPLPHVQLLRNHYLHYLQSAGFGMGILLVRVALQQCVQCLLSLISPKLATNTEAGVTLLACREHKPVVPKLKPFYCTFFPWRGIAILVIGALVASHTPCRRLECSLALANLGTGFGMGILQKRIALQQCVQYLLILTTPKLATNTEAGVTLLAIRDLANKPVILKPSPFYCNCFAGRGIAVQVLGALFASPTPFRRHGRRLRNLLFLAASASVGSVGGLVGGFGRRLYITSRNQSFSCRATSRSRSFSDNYLAHRPANDDERIGKSMAPCMLCFEPVTARSIFCFFLQIFSYG